MRGGSTSPQERAEAGNHLVQQGSSCSKGQMREEMMAEPRGGGNATQALEVSVLQSENRLKKIKARRCKSLKGKLTWAGIKA